MSDLCCARRAFLHSTAVGAVGLTGLTVAGCGGDRVEAGAGDEGRDTHPGETWEVVLTTDELPVGTSAAANVGEHDLLLHRAGEDDVRAFTSVCTHQGCTVAPGDEQFTCPCHGSVFAIDSGEPVSGPARTALTRFETQVADGEIRVKV